MSTTKEKAIERLDALDAEAKKLREIINAPERRTPEQGDVWRHIDGNTYLITNTDVFVHIMPMADSGHVCDYYSASDHCKKRNRGMTYLGKFDEVYVKIEDVRAALSIADFGGDSVLHSNGDTIHIVHASAIEKTRRALAKLNIK